MTTHTYTREHALNHTLTHTITHAHTLPFILSLFPPPPPRERTPPIHTLSPSNDLQLHTATQHTATHCNTLQHTATHCITLHHTASHCHTLPHTATHPLSASNNAQLFHTHNTCASFPYPPRSSLAAPPFFVFQKSCFILLFQILSLCQIFLFCCAHGTLPERHHLRQISDFLSQRLCCISFFHTRNSLL